MLKQQVCETSNGIRIREGRLSTFIVPKTMGTYRTENIGRVRDSEVRVFGMIEKKPMIKSVDIYPVVKLTKTSVLAAIRRLYRRGAIVTWSGANLDGKGCTLYLKVADGWNMERLLALKTEAGRGKVSKTVFECLSSEPQTLEQLVERTGQARTTVWRCLNRLVGDGLIVSEWVSSGHSGRPAAMYWRSSQ